MADGTHKAISEIEVVDVVLTIDPAPGERSVQQVLAVTVSRNAEGPAGPVLVHRPGGPFGCCWGC